MSAAQQRRRVGQPALDLIEESIALLRRAPAEAHLAYYLGAIPFWLGLLYFLSDMSRDAYAASHLADGSLAVTLLYVWKKSWQTFSATRLRAALGQPDAPWTFTRVARLVATQAAHQPWGLLVRPIAAVITIPFVWVSAFYQNVTILGDGTEHAESISTRATAQAKLWPKQAHVAVSVLFVFTLFVWLNVVLTLAAVPFVLKSFFGLETIFSRSAGAYLNTTFFTATVALTSLAVDPLRKAIFVLRCFRGAALRTGDDLTAELRGFSRAMVVAVALLVCPHVSHSSPESHGANESRATNAAELDRRIGEVLERREYAWRAPREKARASEKKSGWLQSWLEGAGKSLNGFLDAFFHQIGRALRWVKNLFNPPNIPKPNSPDIDWLGLSKAILVLLAAAIVCVIGWLFFRAWKQRRPRAVVAEAEAVIPDLRSENIVADQLPEDGWLALARQHAARGELVLAVRAAWLASLAHLGQRELIGIARHKSNRDYERELRRRARDREPLLTAFDDNRTAFERSWYGQHEVTGEGFQKFEQNHERIRES